MLSCTASLQGRHVSRQQRQGRAGGCAARLWQQYSCTAGPDQPGAGHTQVRRQYSCTAPLDQLCTSAAAVQLLSKEMSARQLGVTRRDSIEALNKPLVVTCKTAFAVW